MSELAKKSNENFISAELLFKNNLHASSIHCAYYSSLQKMSDILIENYGYTADTLFQESSRNHIGSHDFIINKTFFNMVNVNRNPSENQWFKRQILDLKKSRVNSDYKEHIIDSTKSGAAITVARKINTKLAQVFTKPK
jgi:uncharacterized protein (UPF0332 family)